jgi:hypothetical protein
LIRQGGYLFIGLIVLGLAYLLLTTPLPPGLPSSADGAVAVMLDFAFVSVFLTLLLIGSRQRCRGFAVAPLLFVILWFSASVGHRVQLQRTTDPQLANRVVPEGPSGRRTLVVETQSSGPICCEPLTLLANGAIETYVHAFGTEMHAFRLALGTACSPEDFQRSRFLTDVGRTDECIHRETIDEMPDGIVLRMSLILQRSDAIGCCNEGTISVRSAGHEEVVARWRYGQHLVLSYFPLFGGLRSAATPLWEAALIGPLQRVQIGGPSFDYKDLGAAIYGAEWRRAVNPARADPHELVRRALALMQQRTFGDRLPALEIALALQRREYIDRDVLGIVASFIEYGWLNSQAHEKVTRFWARLSPGQKRDFLDVVLARLDRPDASDFHSTDLTFYLRTHAPDLIARAEGIFFERQDLRPWQYELALRMIKDQSLRGRSPEFFAQQRRFLLALNDDTTEGFSRRAIGFKRVFRPPTEEERAFFSEQLDLVPDGLLKEYIRLTGWFRDVGWDGGRPEADLTVATRAYRERALVRIARVNDETLRRELQGEFRIDRND